LTIQKQHDIKQTYMARESQTGRMPMGDVGEADYNLNRYMESGAKDSVAWPFGVVKSYLNKSAGIELSPTFIDQFKLEALKWVICKPKSKKNPSSTLLLLGELPDGHSRATTDIADATTMIIVTPKKNSDNINTPRLHVVSLSEKQDKVVIATYGGFGHLVELKVSLSEKEYVEHAAHSKDSYLLEIISNTTASEHDTVGLITKTMRDKVKSSAMLVFKANKNLPLLEKFGYDVHEEDGIATISLSPEIAKKNDLIPWKVRVPRSFRKSSIITSAFHGPLKS
jgi:hypothetical protein